VQTFALVIYPVGTPGRFNFKEISSGGGNDFKGKAQQTKTA
jgi:hypothetical protein